MKRTVHLPLHIPTLLFAAVTVGLYVFFTQFVFAHGGDKNLIHGCIRSNGNLRIINPNQNCDADEEALDWNKEGLPGTGAFVKDLTGAELQASDLRYRNFHKVNLSNANLSDVNFSHANLTGANLTSAEVSGVTFSNNDLTTTILTNTSVSDTDFNVVDLTNKDLTTLVNINSTTFYESNLSGVNLSGQDFLYAGGGTHFTATNLTGANFSFTTGNPIISGDLTQTNFTNATITGASFSEINGTQTNFTNTNLQGSTFGGGYNLTSPIWSNTTCPDGTNSDNNGNTCEGHLTP